MTGGYEDDTAEFLVDLQRSEGKDGYVLDIGANVGLIAIPTALLMRRHGGERRPLVIAIEAVPANAQSLRGNVVRNSLERECVVVECGVGDTEKSVEIDVGSTDGVGQGTGTANIIADGAAYVCERISLRLSTLDALTGSGMLPPGCGVVKIDTDGYDLRALQGGADFVRRERPVIFGEFSAHCMSWHGQSIGSVESFFGELDYSVFRRAPRRWRFARDVDESTYEQDLLLVPREKVERFRWCLDLR